MGKFLLLFLISNIDLPNKMGFLVIRPQVTGETQGTPFVTVVP
uniref:Uncharacterized protein n=1 Tax=Lepeophtheirus salmonis TaxID=72036 RepID=A0A0K2T5W7_LEPSM